MATQITPFTKTPSRQNPSTFSEDMDSRLAEENARIVEMNTQSTENNTLANQVASDAALTQTNKNTVVTDKAIVLTAKDATLAAETRVQALVPLTGTSYSTDALDNKLSASYISSGTIDKQDDANIFEEVVGNEYKMANTDRFVNFDGNVMDAYGPELVTNGDFSDGATGWTSYNTINEVVNGRLKITDNGASASTYMVINVVPNKTYYIDLTGYNGDTNCSVAVMNSNIAFNGGNDIVSLLNFTGTHRLYFTPTNSIIRFQIYPTSSTTGVYCYFDNISIKEITTVDMTNDIPEVMVIGWTA